MMDVSLCCLSVKFCGDAPVDPNAATAVVGTGDGAVVSYTCLSGYLDSTPDDTYTRTCTLGSWVLSGDGPCIGEYYTPLELLLGESFNFNLKITLTHCQILTKSLFAVF
jgi:hypothetical protein